MSEAIDRSVAADDADRQRARLAEGAADRRDRLAHGDLARIAERERPQLVLARLDLQKPDVVEDVPPDDLRLDAVAVAKLDEDLGRRPCGPVSVPASSVSPAVVITWELVRM